MQAKAKMEFAFSTVFTLLFSFMLIFITMPSNIFERIVFLSSWSTILIFTLGIYIMKYGNIRRKPLK